MQLLQNNHCTSTSFLDNESTHFPQSREKHQNQIYHFIFKKQQDNLASQQRTDHGRRYSHYLRPEDSVHAGRIQDGDTLVDPLPVFLPSPFFLHKQILIRVKISTPAQWQTHILILSGFYRFVLLCFLLFCVPPRVHGSWSAAINK